MPNMYIRSRIEREGGSKVTIGGNTYHFKPDERFDGNPHLAEVEPNSTEFAKLLSIPEGYELFVPPANAENTDDGDPATDQGHGVFSTPVKTDDGDAASDTEGQTTSGVEGFLELQQVLASAGNIHGIKRATLDAAFEYLEKRAPHPRAKDETVAAKIFELAAQRNMILEAPEEITTEPVESDEPATNNE